MDDFSIGNQPLHLQLPTHIPAVELKPHLLHKNATSVPIIDQPTLKPAEPVNIPHLIQQGAHAWDYDSMEEITANQCTNANGDAVSCCSDFSGNKKACNNYDIWNHRSGGHCGAVRDCETSYTGACSMKLQSAPHCRNWEGWTNSEHNVLQEHPSSISNAITPMITSRKHTTYNYNINEFPYMW